MPHWKLTLAYDGTPYNGWQVQPNLPTIQGTLAEAIHRITGESVLPQGSGRTDAGVHALAQVASFSLNAPIPPANFHRALNRALPPSIRILSAEHAPETFHARHGAQRKTYEYRIFPRVPYPATIPATIDRICSPMLAPWVWDCPFALDFATLQNAADYVRGTHDFTSFAAVDPDLATRNESPEHVISTEAAKTTSFRPEREAQSGETPLFPQSRSEKSIIDTTHNTRTIYHSSWHRRDGLYVYRVTGSGFLHHMVRNLVGTFAEAATRRISADDIPRILATRNRSAAGPTAPARGLFLVEVEY